MEVNRKSKSWCNTNEVLGEGKRKNKNEQKYDIGKNLKLTQQKQKLRNDNWNG